MIDDITLILEYDDRDRDLFRTAVHKLFSTSFILRGVKDEEELYSFVVRNRDAFDAYCECAGWTLRIDETLGVISWKGPAPARWLLSKDETVFLVVVRLVYEEKRNEISLFEYPVSTVADIHQKYSDLTGNHLKKTRLVDVLRRLASLKLIRPVGVDIGADTQVVLYPSVALALDSTAVNALCEKITKDAKLSAPQPDDEVEETDADQVE
jgi:hypothetical protein